MQSIPSESVFKNTDNLSSKKAVTPQALPMETRRIELSLFFMDYCRFLRYAFF